MGWRSPGTNQGGRAEAAVSQIASRRGDARAHVAAPLVELFGSTRVPLLGSGHLPGQGTASKSRHAG